MKTLLRCRALLTRESFGGRQTASIRNENIYREKSPNGRNVKFRGWVGRNLRAGLISALLLSAVAAHAATLTVTSAADSGPGTLRQAILNASTGDTINFAVGITTITLTSGELLINKNLTINGPGANVLTVQRSSMVLFRIFNISPAGTTTISGLTIAGGQAELGGGVYCTGGTINNCVITNNQAIGDQPNGGGVYCDGGTVRYCVISGNSVTSTNSNHYAAFAQGGGIYAVGQSQIHHSAVINNMLTGYYAYGAGINANNGSVLNCTVSGNTAYGHWYASGGGVYMTGNAGGLVRNCLLSGNNAHTDYGGTNWASGGGVYFFGGGTLESSTMSGNTVNGDISNGGGLTYGGQIRNTIIYGNTAATDPNYYLDQYAPATFDHCDSTPLPPGTANIASDPDFVNGYHLGAGSPCIDTGTNQAWMTTATDLDGNLRIANGIVDMGAFEFGSAPAPTPTPTATAAATATPTPTASVTQGAPSATTNPATNVASYSAILNGTVNPHGLTTTVHFQYGTTTGYGSTTANQTFTGNTTRSVAANIGGLSPSTTYHFRIAATNSTGTTYGSDRTFTTLSPTGPPVVTTNAATLIASFSATLNGSLDPHGLTTTVYFQYGATTSYGSTTASQTKTGNTYLNINANISSLMASTVYHFRIVATNSAGTRYGSDMTFTTLSATGPPVVTTNPATLIASFSATLNGSLDPHGLSTGVYFQYGTTTSYGSTTASQTKTGNTYQSVSANISGLNASTTYHFRIVATNSGGTRYGSDTTFTTLSAAGPAVVTTNPATNVLNSSATLNGTVDPHGLSTSVQFQYGTTTSYGSTTTSQTKTGNTYLSVSANISGLNASTTYHFRIVATNSAGTTHGGDRTFTTAAACSWVTRAPVPYNARGIFAVSDGTYVYAGGGNDGTTARADLLRYNPATNTWSSLAPSADQHYLSQAVFNSGKIYNMGGFNTAGLLTNVTRIYNIATNTWTTGAPMPAALSDQATVLWNGKIYLAGGYNGSGPVNTLYAYNIATNTWSTLAPMPQALYLPGFGAIGGKLYIASGNNNTSESNTLYIYNIASNAWSTGANIPTAVTGPGSTVFCGKLYLYGGGYPTPRNITQIYDPISNSWSSGPHLNVARLWLYGSAVDTTSIVAPGGNTTHPVNTNEELAGCQCP